MSTRGALARPGTPDAKEFYQQIRRAGLQLTNTVDCEALPPGTRAWMKSQIALVLVNAKRYLDPAEETSR